MARRRPIPSPFALPEIDDEDEDLASLGDYSRTLQVIASGPPDLGGGEFGRLGALQGWGLANTSISNTIMQDIAKRRADAVAEQRTRRRMIDASTLDDIRASREQARKIAEQEQKITDIDSDLSLTRPDLTPEGRMALARMIARGDIDMKTAQAYRQQQGTPGSTGMQPAGGVLAPMGGSGGGIPKPDFAAQYKAATGNDMKVAAPKAQPDNSLLPTSMSFGQDVLDDDTIQEPKRPVSPTTQMPEAAPVPGIKQEPEAQDPFRLPETTEPGLQYDEARDPDVDLTQAILRKVAAGQQPTPEEMSVLDYKMTLARGNQGAGKQEMRVLASALDHAERMLAAHPELPPSQIFAPEDIEALNGAISAAAVAEDPYRVQRFMTMASPALRSLLRIPQSPSEMDNMESDAAVLPGGPMAPGPSSLTPRSTAPAIPSRLATPSSQSMAKAIDVLMSDNPTPEQQQMAVRSLMPVAATELAQLAAIALKVRQGQLTPEAEAAERKRLLESIRAKLNAAPAAGGD